MARVKGGYTTHRRHKKVLDSVKGHAGSRHRRFKVAKESLIHALAYSTAHRRSKKRDQRSLMITRVNAAARKCGISYSELIYGMKKSNIELNRKSLSLLAFNDFGAFEKIVDEVKSDLN
tara:strand:+ start:971 stop:1327 length:357 start_codon:yes stop_codon:yes gene_type:complete